MNGNKQKLFATKLKQKLDEERKYKKIKQKQKI